MFREISCAVRHAPAVGRLRAALGPVAFQKCVDQVTNAEGFSELRARLVGDLRGDVLELGTGSGVLFPFYGAGAVVTAIEPDEEFSVVAADAAAESTAEIRVARAVGEALPFPDAAFDAVSAATVLCSVASPPTVLREVARVLRPGGKLRLLEHVRSEHWLAGPLMDLFNPLWLRVNGGGCNWNRRPVDAVREAPFVITSVSAHKIFSTVAPAFPLRLIMAERLA